MKKQSSIEWLEQIIKEMFLPLSQEETLLKDIQQAKQMHKQEMVEFATEYNEYSHNSFVQNRHQSIKSAEEFYNKTFETE